MINICIIGLGRAGRFHLNSIRNNPNFRLRYIVDPNLSPSDEVLHGLEVTLLNNHTSALEDPDLNAIVVSSPTQFHFQTIMDALKAGKHVFSEKPLGKTSTQIKQCFDAAKANQKALHLGFQRRFDKNFVELKDMLKVIGSPRIIKTSSRDNPQPSLDYLSISGNIFHDMLIHDFDMLLFLMGLKVPQNIYAVGHAYDDKIGALDDFDTVMVNLHFEDGLMVTIDTSRIATYGYDQRIEIFAQNGMAVAENQRDHTVQLHTSEGMSIAPVNYSFPQRYVEAYGWEMDAFAQGILKQHYFTVSYEECLLAHLIADAAHESAIKGRVVDFKSEYWERVNKQP